MKEKEKKLLMKKIRKWISVSVSAAILIVVLFQVLLPRNVLSPAAKELQAAVEQAPNDSRSVTRFVLGTIREQERYNFNDRRKNLAIMDQAIEVAKNYLKSTNSSDFYLQLAVARLYFQKAGIAQEEGEIANSTRAVGKGQKAFNELSKTHENNLIFRLYRGINISILPEIFEKEHIAIDDFIFVSKKILQSDFDPDEAIPSLYYEGALILGLERAIQFAERNDKESKIFEEALVKAKTLFGDLETSVKGKVTVDDLFLE